MAVETLSVEDGVIRGAGNLSASYFDMAEDGLLDREATGKRRTESGLAAAARGHSRSTGSISPTRSSAPRALSMISVLPAMLHGRVLRPPSPGAKLLTLEADAIRAMPGVKAVVRDGSFAGVVADSEWNAERALAQAARGGKLGGSRAATAR